MDILWKCMYMCSVCRVGLSDDLAAPEVNQLIWTPTASHDLSIHV